MSGGKKSPKGIEQNVGGDAAAGNLRGITILPMNEPGMPETREASEHRRDAK